MGKAEEFIIWPEYFMKPLSRKEGRRIPKDQGLHRPEPQQFLKICRELGYECEIEEGKYYPRASLKALGYRIIVRVNEEGITKSILIKNFAEKLGIAYE